MLSGRKILIGITGSIAAYKIPLLIRLLVKAGAEVKVVMTPAAVDFVSPLTLSTLTKKPVEIELFREDNWADHVRLGRWADLMLIAPLSCNTLAKLAGGHCDNLLLAVYLSATCPVWVAPAMDDDMWHHASTRDNLQKIQDHGCRVIPVGTGELASGLFGEGRMAEVDDLLEEINTYLSGKQRLKGKKVLLTAGPTIEPIDPVRFISNHSTGKMGYAIAKALADEGAEVTLVSGPVNIQPNHSSIRLVKVKTAEEMYRECMSVSFDIAVLAAAVADYRVSHVAEQKIKKSKDELNLKLVRNPDILKSLGDKKTTGQLLVGFALETEHERDHALKKLKEKNADMMILNSLNDSGAGFGTHTNKITIYYQKGQEKCFPLKDKSAVAKDIVESIIELLP